MKRAQKTVINYSSLFGHWTESMTVTAADYTNTPRNRTTFKGRMNIMYIPEMIITRFNLPVDIRTTCFRVLLSEDGE